MWEIPDKFQQLKSNDPEYLVEQNIEDVNRGNLGKYRDTLKQYQEFANALLKRIEGL